MDKLPIKHISRAPLPWRDADITECGRDKSLTPTYQRQEFFDIVKKYGRQRAQMMTCITCFNACRDHKKNDDKPIMVLSRSIDWEVGSYRRKRGTKLQDEIQAIVQLIDSHRSEFDSNLKIIQSQREWRDKKLKTAPTPIVSNGE